MADDFQLDDETQHLLAQTLAKRPPNAGTPGDPYDLRGVASVVIPVATAA